MTRGVLSTVAAILAATAFLRAAGEVIDGRVISGQERVAGAAVRFQGQASAVFTDSDGRFRLPMESKSGAIYVTVGKSGYYNARQALEGESLVINLIPTPTVDNTQYMWQDPTPNPAAPDNCGNCHTRIYQEWHSDKHSQAAVNPLVLTMYNGTDVKGTPKRGPGYLIDWNDKGDCSTCHAPLAAIGRGTYADLNSLEGTERTGVACDFCHKVASIASKADSPDFVDVKVRRPPAGAKLLFGPFDDATFPGEIPDFTYSPLFKESRLCAPCHDGRSWGVPTYETYTEWLKSSYPARNIQCQDCHMKSVKTESLFANEDKGGKHRDPARIGVHMTMGPVSDSFLRSAVEMHSEASRDNGILKIRVEVKNTGAGHSVPSGQPMRNVILLVAASDSFGRPLRFLDGERVPSWGGANGGPEDYAGRPGKGFAKVLLTLNEYQRFSFVSDLKKVTADFPAPFWRRNRIMSDNRIQAGGQDESVYLYDASSSVRELSVKCTLIYRRAFKSLAEVKGWELSDIVIASSDFTISAQENSPEGTRK